MKGIYLASFRAKHDNYNIIYQDINGKRDISGNMLDINLDEYDYIIATPPCNYYSRANYRRETSVYSQKTKDLLPAILKKLKELNKPYIIENVINHKLMKEFYNQDFVYEIGRHTYWSNIMFNGTYINQKKDNIKNISKNNRQGGENVHKVIDYWLEIIHK